MVSKPACRRSVIVIIIIILILFGCTPPTPTITPPQPTTCIPPSVRIRRDFSSEILPAQQIVVTADASGTKLTFHWQAEHGSFRTIQPSSPSVIYVVPSGVSSDLITLQVQNSCGSKEDEVKLAIKASIPVSPLPPTVLPTDTPTPTLTPTVTPTHTLVVSTTTPVTRTQQATITSVPKPFNLKAIYLSPTSFLLTWEWNGKLAPNQHFAVRFWPKGTAVPKSQVWREVTNYPIEVNNERFPPGSYYWHVAVIEDYDPITGSGDDGTWRALVISDISEVHFEGAPAEVPLPPPP